VEPQWLVNAIARVIHQRSLHVVRSEVRARRIANVESHYVRFMKEGIASSELLNCFWQDFGAERFPFLIDLLKATMLMAEWKEVDGSIKYVVPSVVSTSVSVRDGYLEPITTEAEDDEADVIPDTSAALAAFDFSEFFLPDGLFQRLVAQCVSESLSSSRRRPMIGTTAALLWFGDCAVSLRWVKNENRIVVGFSLSSAAYECLTTVRLVIDTIRAEVMAGEQLVYGVLLQCPPDKQISSLLWVYQDDLTDAVHHGHATVGVASSSVRQCLVSDMLETWGQMNAGVLGQRAKRMRRPDAPDGSTEGTARFHCFLSHRQVGGNHAVGRLQLLLENEGWACWLDMNAREVDEQGMIKGVKDSICFLLFMSKGVFESNYVCKEAAYAYKLNKPFILVREADSRLEGYETILNLQAGARKAEKNGRLPKGFALAVFGTYEVIEFHIRDYLRDAVVRAVSDRISAGVLLCDARSRSTGQRSDERSSGGSSDRSRLGPAFSL
jgi:hypothetical protein